MARLALVSRNPIMSMGLSATAHDIIEVRPSSLNEWLAEGNDAGVDALVLDLGSPAEALRVVGDLRAESRWIPVLIVAGSPTGWDSPELLALPGVDLLTLPIDAARLQNASDAVLRHPKTAPAMVPTLSPPTNPEPLIEEFEETIDIPEPVFLAGVNETTEELPAPDRADLQPQGQPELELEPEPELKESEGATQTINDIPDVDVQPSAPSPPPPVEVEPVPVEPPPILEAEVTPIPVREVAVEEEPSAPLKASKRRKSATEEASDELQALRKVKEPKPRKRARSKDVEPVVTSRAGTSKGKSPHRHGPATPVHPRRRATDRLPDQGPGEVVGVLLQSANVLYTLSETAEVIVEDAIDRAGASAGALLVPDGDVWRVAGGVGLRTLEYRYQLTNESWLIEKVGESHRGLLIENSDVARQALHGAPLASRAHLLAVPVPDVTAVLMLSRDEDPPFTESVLASLAQLAREAGPLLQRAMDLRALSRAMAKHLDPEGAPHD